MPWRSLLKADPLPWLLERRVDASTWVTLQVCTLLKHAFGESAA